MSVLILSAALGAAFSGTVLYAYYDYRLTKTENAFDKLRSSIGDELKKASDTLAAEREDAKGQIRKELEPLQKVAAEGNTLIALQKKAAPSVWFVKTLDEAGQPSVGSAFVVASDNQQTFLLCSYNTVRAATHQPGPSVVVNQGDGGDQKVTLWTWQPEVDLALLILPKGNSPALPWATNNPPTHTGDRVFAMSGLGTAGGAIDQGFVADVSSDGIQHDAAIGPAFQGGPLLSSNGEILGMSSRAYSPRGFSSDGVFFAVPIRDACVRVLKCPSGQASGPGSRP